MLNIGEFIKNKRNEMNMTQIQLSNGICTQGQISKIEKGEIDPSSEILVKIAQKLDFSLDDLFNLTSIEKLNTNKNIMLNIKELINSRNYEQLEHLIKHTDTSVLNLEDTVYMEWAKLITDYNLYNKDILNDLKKILHNREMNISDKMISIIYNSIGVIHKQNHDYTHAKYYFKKVRELHSIHPEDFEYILKIYLNLSNILFELEQWEELYETCIESIRISYNSNNMVVLPELIYSKNYSLNKISNSFQCNIDELNFALFLAERQNKVLLQG
ncbi:helix-turn-helix domain-containing protein [Staphylococcus aureus]|uniref:helix-turn-helix domain-containing protein n=1 Tax=Staphylococcus aureus TaxID=1280 RepID=UPI001BFDE194|nr:helix-turn-helix domain-containing protein [Staphylococcus aureus]